MALIEPTQDRNRRLPRIEISRPIALVDAAGNVATAAAYNISPGGMQIRCDRATAKLLNPGGRPPRPDQALSVDAHFALPLKSGCAKIDVECKVVYCFEILNDDFAIGLEFASFKNYSFIKLDRFVEEASASD